MTSTARKILDEALALPDDERLALMEALSDSLVPDSVEQSPEWTAEIKGRIAQIESGEVELVAWEEVEAGRGTASTSTWSGSTVSEYGKSRTMT